MPSLAYPDELKKGYWDKKKGALDPAPELQKALAALQKQHDAAPWAELAPGWAKPAKTETALTALHLELLKLFRARVSPLKDQAMALKPLVEKLSSAKDAAKPSREAAADIGKAMLAYSRAVGAGMEALERELASARKDLPEDDGEDEPASALLQPKRLLQQLQLCKKDPERRVHFAFVDGDKSGDALLVLHPRMGGKSLFAKVSAEVGRKLGSFGEAMVDDTTLKLVVDKTYSGLVKKVRPPIRDAGFKLSKVVLVDPKGQKLDEDNEKDPDSPDAAGAPASTDKAAAMAAWKAARTAAIATLKDVAAQIGAMRDPESAQGVLEISAVIKNLTAEPDTPQKVAELARYVGEDEVVLDVSELASDIRRPLLKALAALR